MRLRVWVTVLAVAVAGSGCKREALPSRGTCAGSAGGVAISGPLSSATSGYEVDWSEASAPAMVRLDCGGGLVFFAKLNRGLRAHPEPWKLPGDDVHWELRVPKAGPVLKTGSLTAALDEAGSALRGALRLELDDGSVVAVEFALAPGHPAGELPRGVDVSAIPGRISFKRE